MQTRVTKTINDIHNECGREIESQGGPQTILAAILAANGNDGMASFVWQAVNPIRNALGDEFSALGDRLPE
jgi:hypothetical protein